MSNKQRKIDADIFTEGPQDGIEVTIPPPAAVLADQGHLYIALDRLENRAEPGEIITLDDATATVYLAMGLVAPVAITAPALVSVSEDEA